MVRCNSSDSSNNSETKFLSNEIGYEKCNQFTQNLNTNITDILNDFHIDQNYSNVDVPLKENNNETFLVVNNLNRINLVNPYIEKQAWTPEWKVPFMSDTHKNTDLFNKINNTFNSPTRESSFYQFFNPQSSLLSGQDMHQDFQTCHRIQALPSIDISRIESYDQENQFLLSNDRCQSDKITKRTPNTQKQNTESYCLLNSKTFFHSSDESDFEKNEFSSISHSSNTEYSMFSCIDSTKYKDSIETSDHAFLQFNNTIPVHGASLMDIEDHSSPVSTSKKQKLSPRSGNCSKRSISHNSPLKNDISNRIPSNSHMLHNLNSSSIKSLNAYSSGSRSIQTIENHFLCQNSSISLETAPVLLYPLLGKSQQLMWKNAFKKTCDTADLPSNAVYLLHPTEKTGYVFVLPKILKKMRSFLPWYDEAYYQNDILWKPVDHEKFPRRLWFLEMYVRLQNKEHLCFFFTRLAMFASVITGLFLLNIIFDKSIYPSPPIAKPGEDTAIFDYLHYITIPLNEFFANNSILYSILLIIASFGMDVIVLMVWTYWTMFGDSFRLPIIYFIFYLFKSIMRYLCTFPSPNGLIWRVPVLNGIKIKSLSVPYVHSNDFFYSGHIGCSILSATEHHYNGFMTGAIITLLGGVLEFCVMIITRGHYAVDMFAAIVIAHWMHIILREYILYIDRLLGLPPRPVILPVEQNVKQLSRNVEFTNDSRIVNEI